MTISSTASEISYAGDGVSLAFAIPFPFDTSSDLKVLRTDQTTGSVETLTSGFSVSGGSGSTGTLTFSTAPASGYTITILDDPEFTQTADYTDNDAFPATTHERALDRGTRIDKRLLQMLERCLRTADGDPISDLTLGAVSARKGTYLFFNATTGAIEYAQNVGTTTISKSIISALLNAQTAAESSSGSIPQDFYFPVFFVSRYYNAAHASDYSIAAQAAADAAAVNGGTVVFDDEHVGRWGFSSQVTVSSLYPVNIRGSMTCTPNANTVQGQYIALNNNIAGDLIKYVSPTASPNEGGGGIIEGLAFFDDSDPENATINDRRVFTLNAALGLDAFSLSKVENCYFHYMRGSAIRAGYSVMSDYVGCVIRYCGVTGKPAFDHPSTVGNVFQSCSVSRCRLEVCFDEPYIYLHGHALSRDNKLTELGFESETSIAATSSSNYIHCNASYNTIALCHFSRLLAEYAVLFSGNNNELLAPQGNLNDGGLVEMTGNKNQLTGGLAVAESSTIPTIVLSGEDNKVNGTKLYFANAITLTGTRCKVLNTEMHDCTSSGYLIDASSSGYNISNVTLSNSNSVRAVNPSGITVSAEGRISGCRLLGNTVSPAAVGINVNSAAAHCSENTLAGGYTTPLNPNGHMADSFIERNIGFVTENAGQAQVTAAATSVVVTHGLGYTPTSQNVVVWPISDIGSTTKFHASGFNSTQFTINANIAPGGSGAFFGWKASPR